MKPEGSCRVDNSSPQDRSDTAPSQLLQYYPAIYVQFFQVGTDLDSCHSLHTALCHDDRVLQHPLRVSR
jgi:hypothetical protein